MQETPHEKVLCDRYEKFAETLERMYPEVQRSTGITEEWARLHAPELAAVEDKERKEVTRLMEQKADLKVLDKAVVTWCKTQLKIYGRYDEWRKENEANAEPQTAPATEVKQYEQARLI